MSEFISARIALKRELESAINSLEGAQEAYEDATRTLQAAQQVSSRAYDGRERNSRNVDRLERAIAVLDEADD